MRPPPRVLIAGIGNIFFGDDGFGCEVTRRLAQRPLPEGVMVRDFGIRGLDLTYALLDDYEAVILVDAAPLGATPGTVSVIEPQMSAEGDAPSSGPSLDAHGMDPVKVLHLARSLGAKPVPTRIVACEPAVLVGDSETYEDVLVALSAPVQAAVSTAVSLVEEMVAGIYGSGGAGGTGFLPVEERSGKP